MKRRDNRIVSMYSDTCWVTITRGYGPEFKHKTYEKPTKKSCWRLSRLVNRAGFKVEVNPYGWSAYEAEPRYTAGQVKQAMVAVDVATDLVDEPILAEDWRQMVLDKLKGVA